MGKARSEQHAYLTTVFLAKNAPTAPQNARNNWTSLDWEIRRHDGHPMCLLGEGERVGDVFFIKHSQRCDARPYFQKLLPKQFRFLFFGARVQAEFSEARGVTGKVFPSKCLCAGRVTGVYPHPCMNLLHCCQ